MPTLGYISLDESQAFVEAISAGLRDAAADAGVPLVECDAAWTRSGVRACAARLVEAGVAGVISFQPFADLAVETCTTLADAPTIGIVYDQGPCQVARFDIDQAESGRLAGAALGELAARRWDCDVRAYVSLESSADDPIGGARMEGFREGYREHCPLPRQQRTLADAQHFVTAEQQVGGALRELDGRTIVIAAVSDDAALGALAAAEAQGRLDHVWVAGQLAEPDVRERIACDEHLVASVAHSPERFGEVVVPALLSALEGQPIDSELEAELQLVTAETVRTLYADTPACDT